MTQVKLRQWQLHEELAFALQVTPDEVVPYIIEYIASLEPKVSSRKGAGLVTLRFVR